MPKISVIMPVYNTDSQYLKEAIESVLQQTYTNFELLIIDDASTTDIQKVIQKYNDSRIKYIRLNENQGAANARNLGIKKASGEFIAFLDSDDIALSERFSTQINFFESNPNIECVGSSFIIIPEGKMCHHKTEHKDIVLHLLLHGCAFLHSSVMLRTKIITTNNIFYKVDYVPAEDYAFWLDLIGVCHFANIDEILVKYRWHGANISITKAYMQKTLANKARIKKLLDITNNYDDNSYKALLNLSAYPENLSLNELHIIERLIPNIVQRLVAIGLDKKEAKFAFRKELTKLIRKTPSKTIARKACFSTLNNYLHTGFHRQLFYLILRSII